MVEVIILEDVSLSVHKVVLSKRVEASLELSIGLIVLMAGIVLF